MDNSLISLDLFPIIVNYLDYKTLENFKLVNKFCNELYKKEVSERKKSFYPFGESNAMIKFIINDIYLEEIYCIIPKVEIKKISFQEISKPYISRPLDKWFHFSFKYDKWILTGKIIKSVIRLNNKLPEIERTNDILCLTFKYKNKESFLYKIE